MLLYNHLMDERSPWELTRKKWPPGTSQALFELKKALNDLYEGDTPEILIYGSYARGEMNTNSDLDVLLVFNSDFKKGKEINRIGESLAEINLKYQILVSVFPVSKTEFAESNSSFLKNVRNEAIVFSDQPG